MSPIVPYYATHGDGDVCRVHRQFHIIPGEQKTCLAIHRLSGNSAGPDIQTGSYSKLRKRSLLQSEFKEIFRMSILFGTNTQFPYYFKIRRKFILLWKKYNLLAIYILSVKINIMIFNLYIMKKIASL